MFILKIIMKSDKELDENLLIELDEKLSQLKNIEFEVDTENPKNAIIFISKGDNTKTLKDFASEGKIIKEIGQKYNIFNKDDNNKEYIKSFSIIKNENIKDNGENINKTPDNLDNLIYKVPKDDKKVGDILEQLKKIKENK